MQAQGLDPLNDLPQCFDLTGLFISHELGVIRYICDHVALPHAGQTVEGGPTAIALDASTGDRARMLLAALAEPDPDLSPCRAAS